jgi:predicted MFS family arabinose efflux permease
VSRIAPGIRAPALGSAQDPRPGPLVAAMLLVQSLSTSAMLVLAAIAPKVAAEFGVDASLVGYQISVIGGAMMVSAVFLGHLSRVVGAARALQAGIALVVVGCVLALIPSLGALLLGSVLIGLGYGQVTPASSHILMQVVPARRLNLVFSLKQTGVPLGGVVAASAGPIIALAWGWRWAFVLLALLLAALIMLMQRWRDRIDDDRDPSAALLRSPFAGLVLVWRRRRLRLLSIGGAFLLVVQDCLLAYTVVLFVEQFGFGLVAAGLVLTVSQVGGIIGRVVWGWAADRAGDALATLATLSLLLTVACAAVAAVDAAWSPKAIHTLYFALGACATGWNGAYLAEVARLSPARAIAQATGASLVYVNLGKLSGPVLFAQAYALVGHYAWTFGLLALPALVACACLVAARRSTPPAPE